MKLGKYQNTHRPQISRSSQPGTRSVSLKRSIGAGRLPWASSPVSARSLHSTVAMRTDRASYRWRADYTHIHMLGYTMTNPWHCLAWIGIVATISLTGELINCRWKSQVGYVNVYLCSVMDPRRQTVTLVFPPRPPCSLVQNNHNCLQYKFYEYLEIFDTITHARLKDTKKRNPL